MFNLMRWTVVLQTGMSMERWRVPSFVTQVSASFTIDEQPGFGAQYLPIVGLSCGTNCMNKTVTAALYAFLSSVNISLFTEIQTISESEIVFANATQSTSCPYGSVAQRITCKGSPNCGNITLQCARPNLDRNSWRPASTNSFLIRPVSNGDAMCPPGALLNGILCTPPGVCTSLTLQCTYIEVFEGTQTVFHHWVPRTISIQLGASFNNIQPAFESNFFPLVGLFCSGVNCGTKVASGATLNMSMHLDNATATSTSVIGSSGLNSTECPIGAVVSKITVDSSAEFIQLECMRPTTNDRLWRTDGTRPVIMSSFGSPDNGTCPHSSVVCGMTCSVSGCGNISLHCCSVEFRVCQPRYVFDVSYQCLENVSVPVDPSNTLNGTGVSISLRSNYNATLSVQIFPSNSQTVSPIVQINLVGSSGQVIPNPEVDLEFSMPAFLNMDELTFCLEQVKPLCASRDPATLFFVTTGCSRTRLNLTTITCACNHLTDFAAILPAYNHVPLIAVRELTVENINKYPAGITSVLIVLAVFAVVFAVAFYRDRKEARMADLRAVKQAKWGQSLANKVVGHRLTFWKELKDAFQLRHTWASLINRKSGTSFRSVDRSFVTLLTAFASMSMSARFHSVNQTWVGRGEVIVFSVLVCLLPSQALTQLFVRTGQMGFYEEWRAAVGIQKPSKFRLLNKRFPAYCWWIWVGVVLVSSIVMIVYILTISMVFDQVPKYYCVGNTASSWVVDWLTSYALTVFVVEPVKICGLVGLSRLQGTSPLSSKPMSDTPPSVTLDSKN